MEVLTMPLRLYGARVVRPDGGSRDHAATDVQRALVLAARANFVARPLGCAREALA